MSVIDLNNVGISFGGLPVLAGVNLCIQKGEKICLVGRNGEGKSTLLKILHGMLVPDTGSVRRGTGCKTALLSQEIGTFAGSVYDVAAGGLESEFALLTEYREASHRVAENGDPIALAEMERIQHALEAAGGWQAWQQVNNVLSRLALDPDKTFADLSGGQKRKVLLARALVAAPDVLLLDEPTNHLDIESIGWLENFLQTAEETIVFITHDRMLAARVATRILDLDRGGLTSWACDYRTYLQRKEEALAVEATARAKFDKKLSQEETWIRQGIKARRTRNEGRVRALLALREERKERRNTPGKVKLTLQEAEQSGRLVVKAKDISFRYQGVPLFENFSTNILRGDKVGIIGPNGCGKTTLVNVLLGKLQADSGSVTLGSKLEILYFDQLRRKLDEDKTVAENVGQGKELLAVGGKDRHVIGYLQDFLFTPDRARSPVRILSGGERNRLLLAQLFCQPANILVLDEPTNDLDIETLELLEELLLDFSGTVLLVSHDRSFLNNVVTSTIVFEQGMPLQEYAGGYDDWLLQRKQEVLPREKQKTVKKTGRDRGNAPRKLTFKEKFEIEELPQRIETLEEEQQALIDAMADPGFYQKNGSEVQAIKSRLEALETEIVVSYQRWEELEQIRDATESSQK